MAKDQGGHLAWQCFPLTSVNTMPLHSPVLSLAARERDNFFQLIKPLPTETSMIELGYVRWFTGLLKSPELSITTSTDF